jgi:hypothetical protein
LAQVSSGIIPFCALSETKGMDINEKIETEKDIGGGFDAYHGVIAIFGIECLRCGFGDRDFGIAVGRRCFGKREQTASDI